MISQVTVVIVTLFSYVCATVDVGGYRFGGGEDGGYGDGQNYPPKPYEFHYQARDEQGNVHYRNEQGDQSGAVKGSYGYTDAEGLYREVEYVADANGFRATIRTNEPGTDSRESPADVDIVAEQPPAGIQDRWTNVGFGGPPGGHGGGVVYADYIPTAKDLTDKIKAGGGKKCTAKDFDIRKCLRV